MAEPLEKFTIDEADEYLSADKPSHGRILGVVLHHTWRPDQSDYKGLSTLQGIRRYHKNVRHWREIGANYYVAPTGEIWVGRPLNYSNYAHALVSEPWSHVSSRARRLAYPDRRWFNRYALGIEMIADFDAESVEPTPTVLATAIQFIIKICQKWEFDEDSVIGHREVANKSCPGKKLSMEWVRDEVALGLKGQVRRRLKIVMLPGSNLIGTAELPFRPDRRYEVYPHINDFMANGDDPKIFIREIPE